jgi:uncharacterized membrane protein YdjX (TVP38/TMEM64 family)
VKKKQTEQSITIGIVILVVSAVVYFIIEEKLFFADIIVNINTYVKSFGAFAPLIYIGILILAIIISQIPNIPLAISAGILFGPLLGGVYTLIGGMLGALACFFIARKVGVPILKRLFGKTPYFTEHCSERIIGLLLFFSRLFPFFSFDLMSFCAGLTNIKTRTFFIGTFFGMIPITFLLTYMGGSLIPSKNPSPETGEPIPISLIINTVFIVLFITIPILIRRYNLFNLNKYIEFS